MLLNPASKLESSNKNCGTERLLQGLFGACAHYLFPNSIYFINITLSLQLGGLQRLLGEGMCVNVHLSSILFLIILSLNNF